MKQGLINAAVAFLVMIGIGWYSGIDMLERGNPQACTVLTALMMAGGIFIMSMPTSFFIGKSK